VRIPFSPCFLYGRDAHIFPGGLVNSHRGADQTVSAAAKKNPVTLCGGSFIPPATAQ
jgi:hypothetical protein